MELFSAGFERRDQRGTGMVQSKGREVALVDPTPAYRKGLAVALDEAGFIPEEPDDLRKWILDSMSPIILVTIRDDVDWQVVPAEAIRTGVPVVTLLPSPTPAAYSAVLRHGAAGAAPWDAAPEEIVRVLRGSAEGLAVLPVEIVRTLAQNDCSSAAPDWVTPSIVACLRSMAEGVTVGAMARLTECSERAMYRRLQYLYLRMGVSNRSEAIAQASRWGLIS